MKSKYIVFTDVGKAEVREEELRVLGKNEVLVASEYTAVSAGTERANLMKLPNNGIHIDGAEFPIRVGYSGVGIIKEVGDEVKSLSVGDKVMTHWGTTHSQYNILPETNAIKITDADLLSKHAVFAPIAGFSASAVRKTRLEFGESAMVFGIGILGVFTVQLCRACGAVPVIAADLNADRRRFALEMGADYAFDPSQEDFCEKVKEVTRGKGVNAVIEVTGQSVALKQALDIVAPMGRVALLGCTRVSDTPIDFYQKVHRPGVEIIGAHTHARPVLESRTHSWTWQDDCRALLDMMAGGRFNMSKIVSEVHSPDNAPEVFRRLAENKDFPIGVLFDWRDKK